MPAPWTHGETVTLYRRTVSGEFDTYGMPVYETTATVIQGCAVWATSTSETNENQERTNSNLSVALPPGTNVDAVDYLRIRGLVYEVRGERQIFVNPMTGHTAPEIISVTRVEG